MGIEGGAALMAAIAIPTQATGLNRIEASYDAAHPEQGVAKKLSRAWEQQLLAIPQQGG
jgi:hypothetical protein